MFEIEYTNQFKKDFKKIVKRNYDIALLKEVISIIANDQKLPLKYKQHKLIGDYNNFFECHIKPDWLLIWNENKIEKRISLIRTGTHSDLF